MAFISVMLWTLIGLLPDAKNQNILRLHPSGDGSHQSRNSFRCAGAFGSMMKEIPLRNSPRTVLVDDEDYEWLVDMPWFDTESPLHNKKRIRPGYAGYAVRIFGKTVTILMHRILMDAPKGQRVDHKNTNGYDNQKHNLRFATAQQNSANMRLDRKHKDSKFKRVHRVKGCDRWTAYIGVNRKTLYLGCFKTEIEAAMAYNDAAKKHFGEFASLNPV